MLHSQADIMKNKFPDVWQSAVSCAVPMGERIVDVVPGETELELRSSGWAGQAAHARNNPHVKCTGVY